ncbi:hypothetical protein [Herpetosiphon geysericola]|uniref:Uncharacterized protein n=1 Tax=Herpetosiphon geysericola TaxID=70996 RepID=A0A0P6XFA6_9CHLR|nr:hypothetical protein [Herpetosiphon geysericola]KPL81934.1 hypothetical protein SE18_20255 [Herpetosiphon geysericola]
MKCPKCQKLVPDRSRCVECGFPFYVQLDEAAVAHLATHPGGESVRLPSGRYISIPTDHNLEPTIMPLTRAQKNKHLLIALASLAALFVAMLIVGYLIKLGDFGFILAFVGILGLAAGWMLVAHLLDFFNGVAEVYIDRLIETQRYRFKHQQSKAHYYGYFEQLGRVNISANDHYAAIPGALYRLSYGKASQRLLDMVQVDGSF